MYSATREFLKSMHQFLIEITKLRAIAKVRCLRVNNSRKNKEDYIGLAARSLIKVPYSRTYSHCLMTCNRAATLRND